MQHTPTASTDSRRAHNGMLSPESLRHQSDERLVTLARSGSERAWSEIMRRYRPQLRAYSARFVGPGRAEDAVQQTFLQAFLSLRDSQPREIALRAWLYRIAHNCSVDVLRKGTWEHEQLDIEHDGVAQPPTLLEQKEEIRVLVARMRELPDAQRQALALRELEGRSYEEISSRLGHSGSGVRQLIFRARTTLRNGVVAILPFGALRARFSQAGALECHHVASAVSVPASSGGGLDTAGAAALAVVALLGGGVVATGGDSKRARHVSRTAVASPGPVTSSTRASGPAGPTSTPAGRSGGFSAKLASPPAAVRPEQVVVESLPPAPPPGATAPIVEPAPPAEAQPTPEPAGSPAETGALGEDTRQQSTSPSQPGDAASPPATSQPAGAATPAPSEGTEDAPAPASPGTPAGPSGPQSGPKAGGTTAPGRAPARPPKPAPKPAPRKPVKSQPPKSQAPKPQPPRARPATGKSDKSGRG